MTDTLALANLTRRYAAFSRTASGLGAVLGGALTLIAYFVGALAPPTTDPGRIALASTPLIWIAAKELLRARYYQRYGRVTDAVPPSARRWHIFFTASVALVSAIICGFFLVKGVRPTGIGQVIYIAWVVAMPVLVWFFMRTPLEAIVGVFLVAQAALVSAGSHYELWHQPQAPIIGLVLIIVGVRQHREFRTLQRELDGQGQ